VSASPKPIEMASIVDNGKWGAWIIAKNALTSTPSKARLGNTKPTIGSTHYSAADIENLISYAQKACDLVSRKSPALTIVRSAGASQLLEKIDGKGGTRTLDPGIMSAVL
jgi:hypothetical protein